MHPSWQGKLIRLGATEPEDAEYFYHLYQERNVDRNLEMVFPPSSMASLHARVKKVSHEGFDGNQAFKFQIEELTTGHHVGSIQTHHCDARAGTFEYGLSVREQYRGRGYAADAILLVLRYYFLELRYQKANPDAYAFNGASIRLHEKLGFVLEGRRRRGGYSDGEYHDILLFGMTVEEFRDLHPDYLTM